ncbi:MAG: hypothetical protein K2G32_04365 [Oscillospiraceae bacterium]|nr:hypothetical protein [Oscillospiraceae bacterium]
MKKIAAILILAVLTLSACKNHTEVSEPAPTETTDFETMTAEEAEQPEASAEYTPEVSEEYTKEAETTQPESTADCTVETESAAIPDDIEDWRRAYVEYLNGCTFIGGGVMLDDINFDGTPEAVIAINPIGYTIVLYYNENGLQVLELEVASWGNVSYEPETGRIIHTPFYGHTTGTYGYSECYVYEWNGSDYVQSFSELRESGYFLSAETAEYGQAYINGEPVSGEVYDEKIDEFFAQVGETERFPVVKTSDENFEEYMRENFPGFNNWEIIEQMRYD